MREMLNPHRIWLFLIPHARRAPSNHEIGSGLRYALCSMPVLRKLAVGGRYAIFCIMLVSLAGCAATHQQNVYIDPNMDFGALQTVAVMPFANLSKDPVVAERVRDVFMNKLLATGAIYVLPPGEVARGVARAEISTPTTPSSEEVIKLGGIVKAQAVFTGVVKEYGEIRSGTTTANIISLSVQMMETQTGKVVWTAASTKGGITTLDRLFGGGGKPMNIITEKAVNDLVSKLFSSSSGGQEETGQAKEEKSEEKKSEEKIEQKSEPKGEEKSDKK